MPSPSRDDVRRGVESGAVTSGNEVGIGESAPEAETPPSETMSSAPRAGSGTSPGDVNPSPPGSPILPLPRVEAALRTGSPPGLDQVDLPRRAGSEPRTEGHAKPGCSMGMARRIRGGLDSSVVPRPDSREVTPARSPSPSLSAGLSSGLGLVRESRRVPPGEPEPARKKLRMALEGRVDEETQEELLNLVQNSRDPWEAIGGAGRVSRFTELADGGRSSESTDALGLYKGGEDIDLKGNRQPVGRAYRTRGHGFSSVWFLNHGKEIPEVGVRVVLGHSSSSRRDRINTCRRGLSGRGVSKPGLGWR